MQARRARCPKRLEHAEEHRRANDPRLHAIRWLRAQAAAVDCPACGWWWCGRELDDRERADLEGSVDILGDVGIDWRCRDVAQLGELFTRAGTYAGERDDLAAIETALLNVDVTSSNARFFQRTFLEQLRPTLRNAEAAAGRSGGRGHPVNVPLRRVIDEAIARGWPSDAVAASLYLTGAERSALAATRKNLRTARNRLGMRAV